MKEYSKDPNNSFAYKLDRWFTPRFLSPNRQKRSILIAVLLASIFVLVFLPSLSPEMEQKKPLIFIVVAVALINVFFLIYENLREPEITAPPKALFPTYPYKSASPFDPRVEETSKRLLRETTEQLESSTKLYSRRIGTLGDHSGSMKDSSLTRRLDFTRHHEMPRGQDAIGFGRPQTSTTQAAAIQAPQNVFQPFVQASGPNIRSASTSRNVKDVAPPRQFTGLRDSPTRYNYHAGDTSTRKAGDFNYSTSPMRGVQNARNQLGRQIGYLPTKFLSDDEFATTMRDPNYKRLADAEADSTLTKLGILSEFHDWKKNSQRWFNGRLIPKILDENVGNIKELNRIIGYFDKRLHEYEFILKLDQGRTTTENITQKPYSPTITIDELLQYEASIHKGGTLWGSSQLTNADVQRAHQDLIYLIKIRRQLEKYFEIEGFKPFDIRTHVLGRLFSLRENIVLNFEYGKDEIKRRYPTDTEILAHLFFTFLNVEAASQTEDKDKIYRNFVFKNNTNTIPSGISNENVYFSQRISETYEPHYDIISGKDLWTAYTGKDNLFCAIVLFVWHIKTKKHGTLGFEESKTFKEFMQVVIP